MLGLTLSLRKIPVQKQYMVEKVRRLNLIPNHRSCIMLFRSEIVHSPRMMTLSGTWHEKWKRYTLLYLVGSATSLRIYSMFLCCLISQLVGTERRLVSDCGQRWLSRAIISIHFDRVCSSDLPFLLSLMDSWKVSIFEPHNVKGSFMMIYSSPARDATSDTVLGHLAFPIWLDICSSVILFPFGNKSCSMG